MLMSSDNFVYLWMSLCWVEAAAAVQQRSGADTTRRPIFVIVEITEAPPPEKDKKRVGAPSLYMCWVDCRGPSCHSFYLSTISNTTHTCTPS